MVEDEKDIVIYSFGFKIRRSDLFYKFHIHHLGIIIPFEDGNVNTSKKNEPPKIDGSLIILTELLAVDEDLAGVDGVIL